MYHGSMSENYTPTPGELAVARHLDGLLEELVTGKLDGIGVCAVRKDGEPAFFYLNEPDGPVLRPVLNRLLGIYEASQQFKDIMNAPRSNRSYLVH